MLRMGCCKEIIRTSFVHYNNIYRVIWGQILLIKVQLQGEFRTIFNHCNLILYNLLSFQDPPLLPSKPSEAPVTKQAFTETATSLRSSTPTRHSNTLAPPRPATPSHQKHGPSHKSAPRGASSQDLVSASPRISPGISQSSRHLNRSVDKSHQVSVLLSRFKI